MFVDSAKILVRSGKGGDGCLSFLREKFRPRGGPDGGNGGKGGDVIIQVDPRLNTLIDFKFQPRYLAGNGSSGSGRNRSGRAGEDLRILVPLGTLVYDEAGNLLGDLDHEQAVLVVARGGRGGKGNAHFASSTHQAPRFAQPGEPAQELELRLELKLLADVGIIGFPNTGKSTLISRISAARPKIADFPFTTLVPHLGVVRFGEYQSLVFADIPGIIEGAHTGKGLGLEFLRHVERTKLLLHLIDPFGGEARDPLHDWEVLNRELRLFSPSLADKPQIVVVNKCDLTEATERGEDLARRCATENIPIFFISAVAGSGIDGLLSRISRDFF